MNLALATLFLRASAVRLKCKIYTCQRVTFAQLSDRSGRAEGLSDDACERVREALDRLLSLAFDHHARQWLSA